MLRTRSALLAFAAAAATTLAVAGTAQAACTTSSGTGSTYGDLDNDSELGLAPEIGTVRIQVDNDCALSVDTGILRPLHDDDAAFVYMDTDGDAATGDPDVGGADLLVATFGADTGQDAPVRGVWNGTTYAFDAAPVGARVGNGGFRASLDALPIASGATVRFLVVSTTVVGDEIYADFAPGTGFISVGVRYSTVPLQVIVPKTTPTPLPLPSRRNRPPVAAPTQAVVPPARKTCAVPRTKGLSVGAARIRLRAAGCAIATATKAAYSPTVRRGRVVGTTVPYGRTSSGALRLIVSKGRRPR
jgi:hypothetical protein